MNDGTRPYRAPEPKQAPVFDQIYKNYIADVATIHFDSICNRLGIEVKESAAVIPFFGIPHRVSDKGVSNARGERPSHAVSVILCKYLLLCPDKEPPVSSEWIKYDNFKDAAPFAGGFRNTAEQPIGKFFSGRLTDLKIACTALGGVPADASFSRDLAMRFPALPKVSLLLLFNDRDEEFPADCSILFQKHSDAYLDVECLAMLGMVLAIWLKNGPSYKEGTI